MDVHCSTCNEPWDIYHLRHDSIWETDLPEKQRQKWDNGGAAPLTPTIRSAFKRAGYVFGESVYHVKRCPCCPKDAKPDPEKESMKRELVELLGDDEDGIAAMMEDHGL
jgi:hypothetical protein